jgi:uncharacterized protein (TIGR02598 family)
MKLISKFLDNLKEAEDRAARARILASLAAEHEAMSWTNLENLSGQERGPFSYDRSGLLLDRSQNAAVETVYVAKAQVLPGNGQGETLPGTTPSPFFRRLVITVSSRPGAADPFGREVGPDLERRAFLLVNQQAPQGRFIP